jgi:hypothetical protein
MSGQNIIEAIAPGLSALSDFSSILSNALVAIELNVIKTKDALDQTYTKVSLVDEKVTNHDGRLKHLESEYDAQRAVVENIMKITASMEKNIGTQLYDATKNLHKEMMIQRTVTKMDISALRGKLSQSMIELLDNISSPQRIYNSSAMPSYNPNYTTTESINFLVEKVQHVEDALNLQHTVNQALSKAIADEEVVQKVYDSLCDEFSNLNAELQSSKSENKALKNSIRELKNYQLRQERTISEILDALSSKDRLRNLRHEIKKTDKAHRVAAIAQLSDIPEEDEEEDEEIGEEEEGGEGTTGRKRSPSTFNKRNNKRRPSERKKKYEKQIQQIDESEGGEQQEQQEREEELEEDEAQQEQDQQVAGEQQEKEGNDEERPISSSRKPQLTARLSTLVRRESPKKPRSAKREKENENDENEENNEEFVDNNNTDTDTGKESKKKVSAVPAKKSKMVDKVKQIQQQRKLSQDEGDDEEIGLENDQENDENDELEEDEEEVEEPTPVVVKQQKKKHSIKSKPKPEKKPKPEPVKAAKVDHKKDTQKLANFYRGDEPAEEEEEEVEEENEEEKEENNEREEQEREREEQEKQKKKMKKSVVSLPKKKTVFKKEKPTSTTSAEEEEEGEKEEEEPEENQQPPQEPRLLPQQSNFALSQDSADEVAEAEGEVNSVVTAESSFFNGSESLFNDESSIGRHLIEVLESNNVETAHVLNSLRDEYNDRLDGLETTLSTFKRIAFVIDDLKIGFEAVRKKVDAVTSGETIEEKLSNAMIHKIGKLKAQWSRVYSELIFALENVNANELDRDNTPDLYGNMPQSFFKRAKDLSFAIEDGLEDFNPRDTLVLTMEKLFPSLDKMHEMAEKLLEQDEKARLSASLDYCFDDLLCSDLTPSLRGLIAEVINSSLPVLDEGVSKIKIQRMLKYFTTEVEKKADKGYLLDSEGETRRLLQNKVDQNEFMNITSKLATTTEVQRIQNMLADGHFPSGGGGGGRGGAMGRDFAEFNKPLIEQQEFLNLLERFNALANKQLELEFKSDKLVPKEEVHEALKAIVSEIKNLRKNCVLLPVFREGLKHKAEVSEMERLVKTITEVIGDFNFSTEFGASSAAAIHSRCLMCDKPVSSQRSRKPAGGMLSASTTNLILSKSVPFGYDKAEDENVQRKNQQQQLNQSQGQTIVKRITSPNPAISKPARAKVLSDVAIIRSTIEPLPEINVSPVSIFQSPCSFIPFPSNNHLFYFFFSSSFL